MAMHPYKPILINMPLKLLEKLDNAAEHLSLCRSELLRRCVQRDLSFIADHELLHFDNATETTAEKYQQWKSQIILETKE
jgi:metal-responsive CopG/Arc/MetJ family transcriptional regulator